MNRKEQIINRIKNLTEEQFNLLLTLWEEKEKADLKPSVK